MTFYKSRLNFLLDVYKKLQAILNFLLDVYKKVQAMSKPKDCQIVLEGKKNIINHLYWCVASTPNCENEIINRNGFS